MIGRAFAVSMRTEHCDWLDERRQRHYRIHDLH